MASPTNAPFPPVISFDRSAAGPRGLFGVVDDEGAADDARASAVPVPSSPEQAEARIAITAHAASAAYRARPFSAYGLVALRDRGLESHVTYPSSSREPCAEEASHLSRRLAVSPEGRQIARSGRRRAYGSADLRCARLLEMRRSV